MLGFVELYFLFNLVIKFVFGRHQLFQLVDPQSFELELFGEYFDTSVAGTQGEVHLLLHLPNDLHALMHLLVLLTLVCVVSSLVLKLFYLLLDDFVFLSYLSIKDRNLGIPSVYV